MITRIYIVNSKIDLDCVEQLKIVEKFGKGLELYKENLSDPSTSAEKRPVLQRIISDCYEEDIIMIPSIDCTGLSVYQLVMEASWKKIGLYFPLDYIFLSPEIIAGFQDMSLFQTDFFFKNFVKDIIKPKQRKNENLIPKEEKPKDVEEAK
jgi:DNA invertase Pin-like site-specific DNA recombinase